MSDEPAIEDKNPEEWNESNSVTVKQAQELLGMAKIASVYKAIHEERLKSVKRYNSLTVIPLSEITRFNKAREDKAKAIAARRSRIAERKQQRAAQRGATS